LTDISEFLQSYNETLQREIAGLDMPTELTERFTFDSCVKRQDGREVYFISRKSDGLRAVLRVTDSESGENAAAESAVLARLDHPAIPKTLGVWEHNGRGYLVREYFGGEDLHSYIVKHGALSLDMLTDITLRLCDVLSYIHGQNPAVIHRDIKPENIIIAEKNNVKLIDFGIARDFRQDAEKDTRIAGTRPYMVPEQFGSEQTDNRADIYSLGVVMLYMATGKTDKQNLRTAYPYKELVSIIEKCVKKDRDQRYKTAARLKRQILWVRRKVTQKILLFAGASAAVAAAFIIGVYVGHTRGFDNGIASVMDVPAAINRPFSSDELNEQITFDNWYLDAAVRLALNKRGEDTILRNDVTTQIVSIRIYGTFIVHPTLDSELIKTHTGKGAVAYTTSDGFRIDTRGDISGLDDIPNAYYLRVLSLTSQSISDLSPLSGMKLEKINLSDNYVGNLLPLKDMVTLRQLDVCQNPLKALTPISRLLSLEFLDISHTQVTDLRLLAELTKLETLKLNYCAIRDISILAKLPNLREVDLSNTLVTDLSPLDRPDNPVTVRCAGLPDEVMEKARGMAGIALVEE
jgi:hypothetical protein